MKVQPIAKPVRLSPAYQAFAEAASVLQNSWPVATGQNNVVPDKAVAGGFEDLTSQRFECFPEPSGGWLVWDNEAEEPVVLSEVLLSSVSEREAFLVTESLNGLRGRSNLVSCHDQGVRVSSFAFHRLRLRSDNGISKRPPLDSRKVASRRTKSGPNGCH